MIPGTSALRQTTWRTELAAAITDPKELLEVLELPMDLLPAARRAHNLFPTRVPRPYLARIVRGDPHDPLLRQVLPLGLEETLTPGFDTDPVGDLDAQVAPGVLHKYQGRVLLTPTGACAIHCRYCFRRHFPYGEANAARDDWRASRAVLAADTSLHEVILSGGDPLTLRDDKLAAFAKMLTTLPHIKRLRLHTRVPVVVPSRVDAELLAWLRDITLPVVIVLHINHAQEIDQAVYEACARLRGVGVTLLNQSVLLAGVNDDATVLAALSERLFAVGILPYYLHMLDRVQGAAHFAVDEGRAVGLVEALRHRLPGYLVPRLVREEVSAPAKVPVPGPVGGMACCG
ncbi:MAG: EF-P beta-lysylation protein EpmB [Acidiferrobacter sp.]